MSVVTVIGTGNVRNAVASLAVRGGARVQLLGRDVDQTQAVAGQVGAGPGVVGDEIAGDIVTAGGVAAAPVGSLKRARELEAFGFLQISLAAQNIAGRGGGFAHRSCPSRPTAE